MNLREKPERAFRLALLTAVIVGLAVRWLALRGANWRIDYDEGMVGLQVLRMMRGQFAVFHPGQPYLGNLESYLLLPAFELFGANNASLKLIPLLLSGVYVATTGLVGRVAFDRRTGALAGLLAAIAPAYLVVVGLKAWGATIETLVLGNLLLLVTLILLQRNNARQQPKYWLLLGIIMGIAFWISWLITFYAIPALLALALQLRPARLLRCGWTAIPAFFVGSLPLWVYNVQYPLATFTFLLGGERSNTFANAPRVLKQFVLDLAPRLVSGDPSWHILSRPATWLLVALYAAGLFALGIVRRRDYWLLALFVVCFVPIYVLSGFGNNALNPFGIDATGRYVLMLHSVLPIGVALLARARKTQWFVATVAIVVVVTLNLFGLVRIDPTPVFTSPYYVDQPATLQPLIELLDQRGITHVWTQVGIAHVLMFETHERILAADYYDRMYAHGLVRFPDVFDAVARADKVAYVTLILPGQTDSPIDKAFAATGNPYERLTPTPQLLVIIPLNQMDPAIVLPGLGFQYSR